MKDEKENEQIVLTFLRGRDNKIIARDKTGKICLPDINYCKEQRLFLKDGEDWRCAIKEERQNCIIVQPITRTLTAQENEVIYGTKLDVLRDKFAMPPKKRKPGLPGNL